MPDSPKPSREPEQTSFSLASYEHLAELMGSEIYAALFEHADQGKALLTPDGCPQAVNQALCNLLGYRRHDLLKRPFTEWVSEAERPLILAALEQVTGSLVVSWQTEKLLLHRHGQILPVSLQLVKLTGSSSEPTILLLEVQDRRREVQVETAWRAERERLSQAERLARAAHAVWHPASGEGDWSQGVYAILGQSENFLRSFKSTTGLFAPAEAEQLQAAIQAALSSEAPQVCRVRLRQPDGQQKNLRFYFEKLKNGSEQADLLISYVMDISPLIEQFERLQSTNQAISQQNQQLRELAEILDDQLSEPLGAILAISEQQAQLPLNAAVRQGLASLDSFSRELHENRHLDWERLPLSLEVACLRVIQMLEAELASHQVRIALDFSAWTFIEYVPFYLENLLYHLLYESLLHLPPGYSHPLSLYTRFDENTRPLLCLNAPELDLSPLFKGSDPALTPLFALIKDWGGQVECYFTPLTGSQCELQL